MIGQELIARMRDVYGRLRSWKERRAHVAPIPPPELFGWQTYMANIPEGFVGDLVSYGFRVALFNLLFILHIIKPKEQP